MNTLALEISKNLLSYDPETDFRIEQGIETNRKGFAYIDLSDADGNPVADADISFRMLRHEYRFGSNAFMLEQFKEAEKNARYEEILAEMFNLAVLPFYWSDLEPLDGQLRFGKNSTPVYRRPPIDLGLEFCARHNITPKAHVLLWHHFLPEWLPAERKQFDLRLERRIREIAERYADQINIWDVCNEALPWLSPINGPTMPENHVEKSFRMAGKYFPESAELIYNDGNVSWNHYRGEQTPLYMLVRHLLQAGLPVRGLGCQYHLAFRKISEMVGWELTDRRTLLACLDQYAKLGIPVNISEITIPAHHDLGDGDRFQELVAEQLYRLWFSHAATDGIIYWNLVDGTAHCNANSTWNENIYRGGLLNNDLTPKPAFTAIKRLLKEEWTSAGTLRYEAGRPNAFHGFYGDYELIIKTNAGSMKKNIRLSKDAKNEFKIKLSDTEMVEHAIRLPARVNDEFNTLL